jgi:hypothetical protein
LRYLSHRKGILDYGSCLCQSVTHTHAHTHTRQVAGTARGATCAEFDLRGLAWRWGGYQLDGVVAAGNADSVDGLAVDELSVTSGPARLLMTGQLLCAEQEASLQVTDFPLGLLQPLYECLPALRSAAAAAGRAPHGQPGRAPLSALSRRAEQWMASLGVGPHRGGRAGSDTEGACSDDGVINCAL